MKFEGVLLDLSGVLYEGDKVVPGAVEAVRKLRSAGLKLCFLTNSTRSPKKAIVDKLEALGFDVDSEEVFTPATAARAWLAENDCSAYLLVHPNLECEFIPQKDSPRRAVLIGDAGESFNYARLNSAFRELCSGATLLALAKNRMFEDKDGQLSLDAGPFVAALEYASNSTAVVLGKPSPDFFKSALSSISCPFERAVMVGDDAESDVSGALEAGLSAGVLVQTGKYRPGDETRYPRAPTATLADLPAAAAWILAD